MRSGKELLGLTAGFLFLLGNFCKSEPLIRTAEWLLTDPQRHKGNLVALLVNDVSLPGSEITTNQNYLLFSVRTCGIEHDGGKDVIRYGGLISFLVEKTTAPTFARTATKPKLPIITVGTVFRNKDVTWNQDGYYVLLKSFEEMPVDLKEDLNTYISKRTILLTEGAEKPDGK